MADVYGTGLGALPAGQQDNVLPTLTNLPYDVQVTVGTQPAQVIFKGRDAGGCCAAIDLIRFIVPEVSGCHLPVLITINGAPANVTTMSVGPDSQTCSDGENGLSSDLLNRANQNGQVTIGTVNLSRSSLTLSGGDIPAQTLEINNDKAAAGFWSFTPVELRQTRGVTGFIEIGTCVAFQFSGQEANNIDPVQDRAVPKDAGTITLTGPRGTQTIDRLGDGLYSKTLSSGFPGLPGGIPGFPQTFPPTNSGYLDPGNYTVTGSGGPDVGPFTANITVPQRPNTNLDTITSIPRNQPLRITFGTGSGAEYIFVNGFSVQNAESDAAAGAGFICHAPAAGGSFDVPAAILGLLPVSDTVEGAPTGTLSIGIGLDNRFTANGLDQGIISHQDVETKNVAYQ